MADRTVTIRLQAEDALSPTLARAGAAANGLARNIQGGAKASDSLARSAVVAGDSVRKINPGDALRNLGMQTVAAGAAFGLAVSKIAAFESAMSKVRAYLSPTAAEFTQLRDKALEMGVSTAFSATEAAGAITELGKAGVATKDILGGALKGALDLAAAGELDVAEAAETAAAAMTQFKLKGSDVPHIADLLAAGAGKAQGSVHDMGMALKQTGLVASQAGLSIEETTGGLAAFAAAGLTGSDAGTSMKTMLQRLTPQSKEAAEKMAELGISAYDAQGKFIGLSAFADNLRDAMVKLTPEARNAAMAVIFGSDAVRAANVLYEQGSQGISEWIGKVNDAGYAAKVAAELNNNLNGDLKKLGNTFETVMIAKGGGVTDMLRMMTQTATGLVAAIQGLPTPILAATTALVGMAIVGPRLAALGTSIGGSLASGVERYSAAVAASRAPTAAAIAQYTALGFSAEAAAAAVQASAPRMGAGAQAMTGLKTAGAGLLSMLGGPWGVALMGATAAIGVFAQKKADAARAVETFTQALEADSGAMGENTRAAVAAQLEQEGWLSKMQDAGVSLTDATDAIMGNAAAMDRVEEAMRRRTSAAVDGAAIDELTAANLQVENDGYKEIKERLDTAREAHQRVTEAMGTQAQAGDGLASANERAKESTGKLKQAQAEAKAATEALTDAVKALNGILSAEEATDTYTKKLQGLNQATKDNTNELTGNSKSALDNRDKMRDLVTASSQVIDSMVKQGASHAEVKAKAEAMAKEIDQAGRSAGFAEGETRRYSDMLRAIPRTAETTITARTEGASAAVRAFAAELAGLRDKTVTVTQIIRQYGYIAGVTGRGGGLAEADGGVVDFYARGGLRERHVAQIAPAGSWRVWAEPETGGEAYIPLSPWKRARSLEIWEETGRRLGALAYAQGGLAAAPQSQPWPWPAPTPPSTTGGGGSRETTIRVEGIPGDPAAIMRAARRELVHNLAMARAGGVPA